MEIVYIYLFQIFGSKCHFAANYLIYLIKFFTVNRNLHISQLQETYTVDDVITSAELFKFYQKYEPAIPKATVNWRVYELVNKEILERIGKGRFRLGSVSLFTPDLNTKHFKINSAIKSNFPFISYCIWDSSSIKEFVQHLPINNITLVDIERGAEEAVFYTLKEHFANMFLLPKKDLLENVVLEIPKSVIIRTLVSEAPIREVRKVPVAAIEKILVDLFTDEEFAYLRGSELRQVFMTAFERYTISESKMLRYADRKRKKESILKFLTENHLSV